jgi:hypothetical protein
MLGFRIWAYMVVYGSIRAFGDMVVDGLYRRQSTLLIVIIKKQRAVCILSFIIAGVVRGILPILLCFLGTVLCCRRFFVKGTTSTIAYHIKTLGFANSVWLPRYVHLIDDYCLEETEGEAGVGKKGLVWLKAVYIDW